MYIYIKVLNDLKESKINFTISHSGDEGFFIILGDEKNGIAAVEDGLQTFEDVVVWLIKHTIICFPDTDFANKYRGELL